MNISDGRKKEKHIVGYTWYFLATKKFVWERSILIAKSIKMDPLGIFVDMAGEHLYIYAVSQKKNNAYC